MVRNKVKPGDIGAIAQLHGVQYAEEYGLDETFEAYVAGPLSDFVLSSDRERQRIWVVEAEGRVVGCIAIVMNTEEDAWLRWLFLSPEQRGKGIGKSLVDEAVEFSRRAGYRRIIL